MRPILEIPHRAALENSPLCAGLTGEEVEIVLSRCRFLDVAAEREVLSEGQAPTGLHVILEGLVEVQLVRQPDEDVSATIPLGQIGAGGVFGEYSAWDPRPVTANVVTLTPTRLAVVGVRDFLDLIEDHDHLGKIILGNLLRTLIHRLRVKVGEVDVTSPGIVDHEP